MTRLKAMIRTLEPTEKIILKLAALCVVLILVTASLGLALSAVASANQANRGVQGSCQFWRDLSQLPLQPSTQQIALTIVADSRVAYTTQGCIARFGPLPAPDPRVALLLPTGVR